MKSNTRILGKPPRYQAYLLRCCEAPSAHPEQPAAWRFTLEDSRTGERLGFASLDALCAYLDGQTRSAGSYPISPD
jgi:hypothetical protein